MALAFPSLSWWSWGGKDHEGTAASGSPLNASSDFGLGVREPDFLKFHSVGGSKMHSTSRRVKRKWQSREERRLDREYDLVLVPSDEGCLSGSDSDDSDWSIGWLEPHAPHFLNEDECESSFAVLVRCYGRGCSELLEDSKNQLLVPSYGHGRSELLEDSKNHLLGAIVSANLSNGYSAESKKYMEEWLSSLQNI